jgi:glutamine synthetase adenylyltransferase
MILILGAYVGIMILLTLFWGSCTNSKNEIVNEKSENRLDSTINYSDVVEEQLKKSDTALPKIEHMKQERDDLLKENQTLKIELKTTKDSLVATKKLLKKRTFIQKILGTNKDTIKNNVSDTAN